MTRSRKLILGGVTALLAGAAVPAVTASPAQAYCASPALAWNSTNLSIRSATSVPSGWDPIMASAAAQWNGISGASWSVSWKNYNFVGPVMAFVYKQSSAPPGFGGAPGVTDLRYSGSTITGGNIYMNSTFSWNTSGTMNQANKQVDVGTVMVHEMGHEVYLNHPSSCGAMTTAESGAAMNPAWVTRRATNSDDKAGVAARK